MTRTLFPGITECGGCSVIAVVSRPAATTTPTHTVTMAAVPGAAVSTAAQRNDMIQVAHGTYKEEVPMGKPLSLIGHMLKTASSMRQAGRMVSTSTVSTMPALPTSS